jgi:hypothetical protein
VYADSHPHDELDYGLYLADYSMNKRKAHDKEISKILAPLDIDQDGVIDRTLFMIAEPKDKFGEEIWPKV